ncbi:MAG: leucine-rich repeat domain-containing protein [Promethearchaeota archaeon]
MLGKKVAQYNEKFGEEKNREIKEENEEIKANLREIILNRDGKLLISELNHILKQEEQVIYILIDFLKTEDYEISFDNYKVLYEIINTLLDFLDLEEIFLLLYHFDEEKLATELKDNLKGIDAKFLSNFACGLDITVKLILKYLGREELVIFLNKFEKLTEILALYTRQETLEDIKQAITTCLKVGSKKVNNIARSVVNNSGFYFYHLIQESTNICRLNKFITLKLENGRTNIYVKDQIFNQCKFLFINLKKGKQYNEIQSIDEAAEKLDRSLEGGRITQYDISPETEFWGHCSNLQAWVENNYDTRILHRNLAFPLLRHLARLGDPLAKVRLKEEIIRRFISGYPPVISYLSSQGYLRDFSTEDMKTIFTDPDSKFIENFIMSIGNGSIGYYTGYWINPIIRNIQVYAQKEFTEKIIKEFNKDNLEFYKGLSRISFFEMMDRKILKDLIHNPESLLREYYVRLKDKDYFVRPDLSLILAKKGIDDISEIKGINRIKNLRTLDLRHNNIREIKGLENLENLKRLKLRGNPLPEALLEELGGLDKWGNAKNPQKFVEYCRLYNSLPIETVRVGQTKYQVINDELVLKNLGITAISEIKGISKLKNLKNLDLSNNNLKNLKGIESLESLEILDLHNNQLKDLEGLDHLFNLKILRLYGNGIFNFEIPRILENLEIVLLDNKRKVEDREYLEYLLPILLKKELLFLCRRFGKVMYSKLMKYRLIDLILTNFYEEELKETIKLIEKKVIDNGINEALRTIYRKRKERVRTIEILPPKSRRLKIDFSGNSYISNLTINKKVLDNPIKSCNCQDRTDKGLCRHFWIGIIFALKKGYFKISDWTMTYLPDDFEEKIQNIEIKEIDSRTYKFDIKK